MLFSYSISGSKPKTVIRLLLYRYIRLIPLSLFVMLLPNLVYNIISGPELMAKKHFYETVCARNWPYYLINVQNFLTSTEQVSWLVNFLTLTRLCYIRSQCFLHYWYLGADTQLFLLALIPVYVLLSSSITENQKKHKAIFICKIIISLSIIITGIETFLRNAPPGFVTTERFHFSFSLLCMLIQFFYVRIIYVDLGIEGSNFFDVYLKPWTHASPYFIGFILGLQIISYQQNQTSESANSDKVSNLFYLICIIAWCFLNQPGGATRLKDWLIVLCCYAFCIFYTVPWLTGRPYNPYLSAVLFPLSRLMWGIMLNSLFRLNMIHGDQSVLFRFLSHPVFKPLSRLTYSAYLIHIYIYDVFFLIHSKLIALNPETTIIISSIVILWSFIFSIHMAILIELPIKNTLFLLYSRLNNKIEDNSNDKSTL